MPMQLEGSCKCGAIRFAVASHTPVPYQLCYCSICRKTGGGGGYAINLAGVTASLDVEGETAMFHAPLAGAKGKIEVSGAERHFCPRCGTALWLFDEQWPELIHPFASAIDTPLPKPPVRTHLMLGSKAPWVEPAIRPGDLTFDGYPEDSIEDWHRRHGLWVA